MNRLEANVSLIIITFFAAIQYAFLSGVPDSVSHFAFLCMTNSVGFLLALALFWGELFRVDGKQIIQSLVLSLELLGFNLFLLLGSSGVGATVSACVLSAYFVFIPLLSFVWLKERPNASSLIGSGIVLAGLFLMMGADPAGLMNIHILYLAAGDIFFALYILTVEKYTKGSNPSILAMGQMLFSALFAALFWLGESILKKEAVALPKEAEFWGSVIFIGFFIRGLYGIVQIYAQRYVTALATSLIFSTEIIMTMLMSPVLAFLFDTEEEEITLLKLAGGAIMVLGILVADGAVFSRLRKRFSQCFPK